MKFKITLSILVWLSFLSNLSYANASTYSFYIKGKEGVNWAKSFKNNGIPGDLITSLLGGGIHIESTYNEKTLGELGPIEIGNELFQILGQIVVDHASNVAYEKIKNVITINLCPNDEMREIFHYSCSVLDSMRLQDIANSPEKFKLAFIKDGIEYVKKSSNFTNTTPNIDFLLALIVDGISKDQNISVKYSAIRFTTQFFRNYARDNFNVGSSFEIIPVLVTIGLIGCNNKFADCPIEDFIYKASQSIIVDKNPEKRLTDCEKSKNGKEPECTDKIILNSQMIAIKLLQIYSTLGKGSSNDIRKQNIDDTFLNSTDALFIYLCVANAQSLKNPCPKIELLKNLVLSGINHDNDAAIVAVNELFKEINDGKKPINKRTFYIISGLLQYTSTNSVNSTNVSAIEARPRWPPKIPPSWPPEIPPSVSCL